MTEPDIDIAIEDARWESALPGIEAIVARAVSAGLDALPDPAAAPRGISILLADDPTVPALNRRWRGKARPPNVLSFTAPPLPLPPGTARPLGDVVLAYDTMLRESAEQSKPLEHHLVHLLVHGTLHLLGQDHETGEAQAEAMEALEIAALAKLGIPNPYAD